MSPLLSAAVSTALVLVLLVASASAQMRRQRPIQRPAELNNARQIERFVMQVLADRTKRQDPFIKSQRQAQKPAATYEIGVKPRPLSGFASYDIDQLTLMAIWKESEKVTATFRSNDGQLFIVSIGDEAYDGKIVEISFEEKSVKFLRKLKRVGPKVSGQPDFKYESVVVRMHQ